MQTSQDQAIVSKVPFWEDEQELLELFESYHTRLTDTTGFFIFVNAVTRMMFAQTKDAGATCEFEKTDTDDGGFVRCSWILPTTVLKVPNLSFHLGFFFFLSFFLSDRIPFEL